MRSSLLLLLLLALAPAGAARAQATNPAVGAARLDQQLLPALAGRADAARARVAAADSWFSGTSDFAVAFPQLDGAPLTDRNWLDGALRELDGAGTKRAAERVAPPADALSDADAARRLAALQAALDEEDRADGLRRRLLEGLRSAVDRAPGLSAAVAQDQRAEWARLRAAVPTAEGPARQDALRVAKAAGDAEAALNRLTAVWVRAATIPGDGALDAWVAAELAQQPAGDQGAAGLLLLDAWQARLDAARPMLAPTLRGQVDAALALAADQARQARLPVLEAELATLRARLEANTISADGSIADAERRLADAQAQLAQLPPAPPPGPVPAAGTPTGDAAPADPVQRRVEQEATLRRAIAEASVDVATRQLAAAKTDAEAAAAQEQVEVDVNAARAKADKSLARASAASTVAEGKVRLELAALQDQIASALEAEQRRNLDRMGVLRALADEVEAARLEGEAAVALTPLAAGRGGRIDGAYLEQRRLVEALRQAVADGQAYLESVRSGPSMVEAQLPDLSQLPPDVGGAVADELGIVNADLEGVAAMRLNNALSELDQALAVLTVAKVARRELRSEASSRARDQILGSFNRELRREFAEAPVIVRSDLRAVRGAIQALPTQATNLGAIASFLTQSVELVVLVVLWVMLRRNAEGWTQRVLSALWESQQGKAENAAPRRIGIGRWTLEGDVRALAQPLAPLLFALVDFNVAWYLFRMTRGPLTLLALVILIWLSRSLLKGSAALVAVVWAPPDSGRPSFQVLGSEVIAQIQRSVRVVVAVVLVFVLLRFIALDVVEADRLADLVATTRTVAIIGVVLWLLLLWSSLLRQAVALTGGGDPLAARLMRVDGNPVMRVVRSAGALGYLLWRGGAELVVGAAEGWPGLGWLASALARARLRSADRDEGATPLTADLRAQLDATDPVVPRPVIVAELKRALGAWGKERRRGMVALVGPRGSGKTQLMNQIATLAAETLPDVPVVHLALDGRTHDPDRALKWLSTAVGCPECGGDAAALVAALSARPARVFVIDDVHLLVLRAVGGFAAVKSLFNVMQATSEEHFWVTSHHSGAWSYLSGVSSSVNLEAFGLRVMIPAMAPAELGQWVTGRVRAAGLSLRFDALVTGGTLGVDPTRARDRAEQAFWRLLADASLGVPDIAWGYFLRGLTVSAEPGVLDVHMFKAPNPTDLESLSDLDLFVLTALLIHDHAESASISEVLNASLSQVQESCRRLDALDVVDVDLDGPGWAVLPEWRPAVERLLRQKHFLYMR